MRWRSTLLIAAAAAGFFLPEAASAHCPVSYVVTGPGGLYWQISLAGWLYDGMLPGGTTSQLGAVTSWADMRRIGLTTGMGVVSLVVADGTNSALCPPVTLNLSGPPGCDEDFFGDPAYAPHPLCIPYFTVVRTAPGVYSCSSTCQVGTFPPPQAYSPPLSTPPTLSAILPRSAAAGADIALDGGSVSALVPGALLTSPGTASVTVAIPGSASAPLTFTITP